MDGQGNIKVSAPKNISFTAGQNINISAGQNITTTAGMNISASAGMSYNVFAGGTISQNAVMNYTLTAANITEIAEGERNSTANNIKEVANGIDKQSTDEDIKIQGKGQVITNSGEKSINY